MPERDSGPERVSPKCRQPEEYSTGPEVYVHKVTCFNFDIVKNSGSEPSTYSNKEEMG